MPRSCLPHAALLIGLLLGPGRPASARLAWNGGGRQAKAGPAMINLKLGPSIPIYIQDFNGDPLDALPVSFALQLEGGVALDRARNAYLILPFQIHVGRKSSQVFGVTASATYTKIVVPLGFQYDIPIPGVPGLYVYPRASLGYAAFVINASAAGFGFSFTRSGTYHGGMFAPELGIKYLLRRRVQFGLEPMSLPLHFYTADRNTVVVLDYRLHGYVGALF